MIEKIKSKHQGEPILVNIFPTTIAWIMHEKDLVVEELDTILDKCMEQNVKFHWV